DRDDPTLQTTEGDSNSCKRRPHLARSHSCAGGEEKNCNQPDRRKLGDKRGGKRKQKQKRISDSDAATYSPKKKEGCENEQRGRNVGRGQPAVGNDVRIETEKQDRQQPARNSK